MNRINKKYACNNGSISSVGLMLFILVLAYSLSHLANSLEDLNYQRLRNKSYLCAKSAISLNHSFIKIMAGTNTLIRTNYYLQFVPYPAVSRAATRALKALIKAQNLYYAAHILRLSSVKRCSKENILSLIVNPPTRTKGYMKFKRSIDRTVEFKKKWKNKMIFKDLRKLHPIKHSFVIALSYEKVSGSQSSRYKLKTSEKSMAALWNLKQLAGQ